MRVLRDCRNCVCAAVQVHGHSYPPTAQPSLKDVKEQWNEWELHFMILVSFGLQMFLLFAAGLRRRSVSRLLTSLLWLAYLSADFVAIFVLGHLAVHANGPRHQLLFFWAPFVLLHLGGQHTITALSMQDNQLWRRHLLGFVSQVAMAIYVISRSSWPDIWLKAAMSLMMMIGVFRYAERTICLWLSDPNLIKDFSLLLYYRSVERMDDRDSATGSSGRSVNHHEMKARLDEMLKPMGDMQLPSIYTSFHWKRSKKSNSFSWETVLSSTPLNYAATIECANGLPELLKEFKQKSEDLLSVSQEKNNNKDRCPAYNYVGALLCAIYERLYTKVVLWIPCQFLLLPLFSILLTLGFFMVAVMNDHHKLYSLADVIVSYILLIGALILEVASLFIWLSSYTALTGGIKCGHLTPLFSRVVRYVHSSAWARRKQWSEILGQQGRIKTYTRREGIMSFVPERIAKLLYDRTLTHKPVSEDLKMLVLNKLLDFGIGDQQDWNFASTHGQLALRKRIDLAGPGTPLYRSINDGNFITSLLIWHIATDICYYHDDAGTTHSKKKDMSQELSYYVMYLVFHCNVLHRSSVDIIDTIAYDEMEQIFENLQPKVDNLGVKEAIGMVFRAGQDDHQPAVSSSKQPVNQDVKEAIEIEVVFEAEQDGHQPPADMASSSSHPVNHVQSLRNTMETINSPVLPRTREVARELISIHREADRWDLIADVWLEMLYYVAPRCGGGFHLHHLSTGGEFITHVLLLMHQLGPFLPPPGDLVY